MKDTKKIPLFVPVLWFITTGMWTVTFCINFRQIGLEEPLVWLQGATVLASLAAAVANTIRYRNGKEAE